ncbi:MAG TPA: molybdopterin-dependent oxidoreductase [Thermodesulfobacteriota bacterium]|nr:molybdopterin-dependent oxidoreductase [Thermodesulfobacteriota bacterium]
MSQDKKGGIKRRDFLKIIGVAGGTAAVAGGCSNPAEQLIPYVIPPEGIIPGVPNFYASTCRECPAGCGIVVKNREGRAIKVEGNPKNPINMGGSCAEGQAMLQGLYNPDRLRSPLLRNDLGRLQPLGWDDAQKTLAEKIDAIRKNGSGKIVFLSDHIEGTLGNLISDWMSAIGGEHITYEVYSYEPLKEANRIVFGIDKIPTYSIDKSKYLLSFGADFLETWLSPTLYTRQFSQMHSYENGSMGKFVYVDPRAGLTGVNADEWVSVKPGTEALLALGIASAIVSGGMSSNGGGGFAGLLGNYTPEKVSSVTDVPVDTIKRIAKEFSSAQPSLAIGGGVANTATNATETQVAINILNYVAGNVGQTIDFGNPLTLSNVSSFKQVSSLVDSMKNGQVALLFIYNVNPVFTLPKSLGFEDALGKVPNVVSFSSFMDETTEKAGLLLPDNTTLESWGDFIPDGKVHGLIQPIMTPVFNTKGTGDVILAVAAQLDGLKGRYTQATFYDYLRDSWKQAWTGVAGGGDFETFWKDALENGGFYREAAPAQVSVSGNISGISFSEPEFKGDGDYFFVAYPSYKYYDGRGANKPWLQELPDAITTGVWDSWVEMHPDTAAKLGVKTGDFVKIESPEGAIETQAYVYEGIRPDTLAVQIGQGHTSYGRYAKDRGVNPIAILPVSTDRGTGSFAWLTTKVKASGTGRHAQFVQTQYTTTQHDRDVAQMVALTELERGIHREEEKEPDFYPEVEYARYQWGMSIDLQKCTGCGACVTACYAENNIAFVGKELVAKRRDMSWIRIERYFEKSDSGGGFTTQFLPMLCQQCNNAPCEPVCPVFATYHNPEGLNGMVYNRCVGTRYCSNNCTYSVRKFNWFSYKLPEPLNWQYNPDVTVRDKGVMEKCTFCIQRINYAKDQGKDKGRDVLDGEVQTACQQACASGAIVFGNLKDDGSRVSKLSQDERGYKVLRQLNTKPNITYLKKVKWDKA